MQSAAWPAVNDQILISSVGPYSTYDAGWHYQNCPMTELPLSLCDYMFSWFVCLKALWTKIHPVLGNNVFFLGPDQISHNHNSETTPKTIQIISVLVPGLPAGPSPLSDSESPCLGPGSCCGCLSGWTVCLSCALWSALKGLNNRSKRVMSEESGGLYVWSQVSVGDNVYHIIVMILFPSNERCNKLLFKFKPYCYSYNHRWFFSYYWIQQYQHFSVLPNRKAVDNEVCG